MISSLYRFHGYGSLRYVYKNGNVSRGRFLTVKSAENKRRRRSRMAVVVSKKVLRSAVGRNRIRRRVYEVLRLLLPELESPYDIVCIISSSELKDMPFDDLIGILKTDMAKAGLYKKV